MAKGDATGRTTTFARIAPPDRSGRIALLISTALLVLVFGGFAALCAGLNGLGALVTSPVLTIVAAFLAVTLAMPYLLVILWVDRNDSEPPYLIASALGWGAIFATGLSMMFNELFGAIAGAVVSDPALAQQLTASLSAPLVEETTKGAALVVLYLFFRRHFDNVLDGVVYGALVGLGFAVFENFIYYVNSGDGMMITVLVRGVITAVGTHACFTAITGAGFGAFRVMRSGVVRWAIPVLAWMLAMFVHFSWNTFSMFILAPFETMAGEIFVGLPIAVVILQFPFVAMVIIVAIFALAHEGRLIRQYLTNEKALLPGELDHLLGLRRTLHLAGLLFTFQLGRWFTTVRRNRRLIRLAFEKWHMDREAAEGSIDAREHAIRVRELREELGKLQFS